MIERSKRWARRLAFSNAHRYRMARIRIALWLAPLLTKRQLYAISGVPKVAGAASAPYDKMLIASANIYYAPIGEPFPAVAAAPAGNWTLLAAATDITEDGITIETQVQDARIFSLGGVAPVKAGIVQKQFTLSFSVMNAALEQQALASGGDPDDVTDNGTDKEFSMPASPTPQGWAILVRWDQSPEGDALNSQFEIKSAVQVGAAGGVMSKSNPFAQAYALVALYTDADWVVIRVGDQAGT